MLVSGCSGSRLVDHAPELVGCLRMIMILVRHRQLGAEKEIADRILVKHSVDQDSLGMAFKINPVIAAAIAMQCAAIALDLRELFAAQGIEIFGKNLKLGEQIELEILGKCAHFRRACGVKYYLKHAR